MKIQKGFRFRIYPHANQQKALAVQFGHARFVYDWGLETGIATYQETGTGLSEYDTLCMLPDLKTKYPWRKDAHSQVLQQKLRDLQCACVNFCAGWASYPQFKKKRGKQSVRYPQGFKFNDNRLYLPKAVRSRADFTHFDTK